MAIESRRMWDAEYGPISQCLSDILHFVILQKEEVNKPVDNANMIIFQQLMEIVSFRVCVL